MFPGHLDGGFHIVSQDRAREAGFTLGPFPLVRWVRLPQLKCLLLLHYTFNLVQPPACLTNHLRKPIRRGSFTISLLTSSKSSASRDFGNFSIDSPRAATCSRKIIGAWGPIIEVSSWLMRSKKSGDTVC